jgi:hypothetical protein
MVQQAAREDGESSTIHAEQCSALHPFAGKRGYCRNFD